MADHEVESEVWMCVKPWSFYLNEQRHDASDHNEAGMCRQDQLCLNSLYSCQCKLLSLRQKMCCNAVQHSLLSFIFFSMFIRLIVGLSLYWNVHTSSLLSTIDPISCFELSLFLHNTTYAVKNGLKVNTCPNLSFDLSDLCDLTEWLFIRMVHW